VVDKASLKRLVAECYKLLGNAKTAAVLDNLKRLGFQYATKSGTTIAMNDIEVPPSKALLLEEAERRIAETENQYHRGLITEDERYASAVQIWTEITDRITDAISNSLDRYGGVYLMANSGAKGNIAQIRQMAGMRGLMADPSGRIIDFPIRSSFREGLSVLEYFISTHGARKGLADTALRTSDSGYLTRRLIDVAQDVIVLQEDCGASAGVWIGQADDKSFLAPLAERLVGRVAVYPVADPKTGEILVERNQEMDEELSRRVVAAGINKIYVRSPLTCLARRGVCRFCYGRDLARGHLVALNTAVGIIAAESIGEPGTQLTMRTFHTGGVVGLDITSGLPRVEDLFEARAPKGEAKIADIDGVVEVLHTDEGRHIKVVSSEVYRDEYPLPSGYRFLVTDGDAVAAGAHLAQANVEAAKAGAKDKALAAEPVLARVAGRVSLEDGRLIISYEEREERDYLVPAAVRIRVETGARVRAGDQLTDGPKNPQDILRIMGREAVQQYLVEEVQKVYRSQGVNINDKHIEIIVRQMLAKVMVESSGDTELLPGQLVDRFIYEGINAKVLAEGGEPATAQAVLLGITRASLTTESWMAAASFQETTRVLTEAAISGKIDRLLGLKENVIIGKLIPARSLEPEPLPVAAAPSLFLSEGGPPSEPVKPEDY
jgi:DNA-directed RNA polymerase subunit beta'